MGLVIPPPHPLKLSLEQTFAKMLFNLGLLGWIIVLVLVLYVGKRVSLLKVW